MGCASSKQQKRCRHCQNLPYTPVTRSYSMHVHHPPQSENDTYHLVALTSTTLGYLAGSAAFKDSDAADTLTTKKKNSPEELAVGLVEAKTWSAMIDRKIPKIAPMTPVRTPPGEPETINAWELMEGLEDVSPFRSPIHLRSFSFDVVRDPKPGSPPDPPKSRFQEKLPDSPPPKPPMWLAAAEEEKREKVVLYFTSLRGVRKTYEECCEVRAALKALGVRVDERDVSMHSGFRDELRRLDGGGGGLPRVLVGEKSIGGAEDIGRLIEDGQLEKVLENCERGCDSGELSSGVCEACGDVRFVPCETCSGSCKVYYESEEEEKEESSEDDYGFQRCPDCNENGLIRCPICCY